MKNTILFVIIFLSNLSLFAQTKIIGKITDNSKQIIAGANVYIKDTYDGTSSNEKGEFVLNTTEQGEKIIMVSFIGFKSFEKQIKLNGSVINIDIELEEVSNQINTVSVTAGAFEASDKKKGTVLKPLDIVTTASALGDIYSAMNALPGTTKVGEKGELFVRGGEGYESKTFIDGLLVQKPYTSTMPDLPSRGRFSPMLFSGTLFSSGGYSAEYGQAMSSALILNTQGLVDENLTSVSLMSVGFGLSHSKRFTDASITVSADYANLSPYYNFVKQDIEWQQMPEDIGSSVIYRLRTSNSSMLKLMGSYSQGTSKIRIPNINDFPNKSSIGMFDKHTYINSVFNSELNSSISLSTGVCYSYDYEKFDLSLDEAINDVKSFEAKYTLNYTINNRFSIKFGNNFVRRHYIQTYASNQYNYTFKSAFEDNTSAMFVETEVRIGKNLAARVGVRGEYSTILTKYNLAPRFSIAYKTSESSQISVGYGSFYQTPQDDVLSYSSKTDFENAIHYIANYQYMKNNKVFRIEAYYKEYNDLVKYNKTDKYNPYSYSNSGNGFSKGVDIFWRDQNTFKNGDYWISYSYIDSKRNYKDYEKSATPTFISNHNFSFIGKYYVSAITSQVGFSYTYSSGRTYYNPANIEFLGDKTDGYHDLSVNISYLTRVFGGFTVIYCSVNNVLGFDNIYGYRFSDKPVNGTYVSIPVKSPAKRFFFIGMFISLK